ncbi:hypothetical protein [Rhizobium laguerreae]|uniref:hypothetical protein n=1 Tax=Rhizobium laguerreae TaxID=1076926 RepID=UPI00144104EA|nr:hypothetical protein [Rhizobium laguerreae]NKN12298.1 hypothetical protein [Rhizobium laguerreae]
MIRDLLGENEIAKLVRRLNNPKGDRLAAMWEVVVFSALAKCGDLKHEQPLSSGAMPDILFQRGALRFIADLTCVSDDGLDQLNPYEELFRLVTEVKTKLGLPSGGMDLRVGSIRAAKTTLRLPARKDLHQFVQTEIRPKIRDQIASGASTILISIDDDRAGIEIIINPAGGRFSYGGYSPYDVPTEIDSNPLYNAIKAKASGQLRAAEGVKGIIVGDGNSAALGNDRPGTGAHSPEQIARELLRQFSSIDFVLLLAVRDGVSSTLPVRSYPHVKPILVMRENDTRRADFVSVFNNMIQAFPKPVDSASNGARRAAESGYDLGHHGAYDMKGDKIRISAREALEVLAGVRTFDDGGAKNVAAARTNPDPTSEITKAFLRALKKGYLPTSVSVVPGGEDENDDWIEFEFGVRDPAISPFR